MPYIIVSNLTIEPVKVIKDDGMFSILELQTGGRIQLRNSRIFPTKEEAASRMQKKTAPQPQVGVKPTHSLQKTPYDYESRPSRS